MKGFHRATWCCLDDVARNLAFLSICCSGLFFRGPAFDGADATYILHTTADERDRWASIAFSVVLLDAQKRAVYGAVSPLTTLER